VTGDEPLRVLLLDDAVFEDLPGGSRLVARELARGLTRRGHAVTTLAPRHPSTPADAPDDETIPDRGRVVRYAMPEGGGPPAFFRAGADACRRLPAQGAAAFDVAHSHFAYASLGPLRALGASTARVRTFHGPWDEECFVEEIAAASGAVGRAKAAAKRALRARVERQSLTDSDRVTVLSDAFRALPGRYGVDPARVEKIPGGVDLRRFHPDAVGGRVAARTRLSLPTDRRVLLSVRRLAPRMGLENLIAAMPEVARRHPDVLLLIGGKGPHRGTLEAAIRAAGVGGHVRLLGFVDEKILVDLYRAADLFVLPTMALEGFGLVTVEALASGTPVVGTPVGATPELLGDVEPRLLAAGCEPGALAAAVAGFLDALAAGPGSWAGRLTPDALHAHVAARYSWDRHVDATLELYRAAVVRKGTGRR